MASIYRYDPMDRLINCLSDTQALGLRFYCANKLATEIQGVLSYSLFQYDKNVLAQHRQQAPQQENTLLATDPQGSVIQAIKNTQHDAFIYNLYGHQADRGGLASLLGFNGERREPLTGHYLLGNGLRAFNPVLMRFNSPDPMSPFEDGGINAYAYCKNDPINWNDPSGNIPVKTLIKKASSRIAIPRSRATATATATASEARRATWRKAGLKMNKRKGAEYARAVAAEKRGEFIGRVSVNETPHAPADIKEAYRLAQEAFGFKALPSSNMAPHYIAGPLGHPSAVDTSAFFATHDYLGNIKYTLQKIPNHQRSPSQLSKLNTIKNQLINNKKNRLIYIHKTLSNIRNH